MNSSYFQALPERTDKLKIPDPLPITIQENAPAYSEPDEDIRGPKKRDGNKTAKSPGIIYGSSKEPDARTKITKSLGVPNNNGLTSSTLLKNRAGKKPLLLQLFIYDITT